MWKLFVWWLHIHTYIYIYIQGVSKRALQLWKLIEIYTEDIHNVLDEDDQDGRIHFQQDGAPPHYLGEVRGFPGRWIVRAAPIAWPPRSPDLTPMDFFLWGFVKDQVFVPPFPANVVELRTRITAAVAKVTPEMLRSVWQETDYRWEVCRITSGSHIES